MPEILSTSTEDISNTIEKSWDFEYETYKAHNWFVRKFPGIFLDASSLIKYFEYQRRQNTQENNKALVKHFDKDK